MLRISLATIAVLVLAAAPAFAEKKAKPAKDDTVLDHKVKTLEGKEVDLAKQYKGKVLLIVNVASECGLTPQYDQLQALYESRRDKGLVIVGVPCNQFGNQEPGSSEQIASFCKLNYGVTFPLLEKQEVNGDGRSSLYHYLVGSTAGGGGDIKWNFEKFLVSPAGDVVGRWGSGTKPDAAELVEAIERVLPKS